MSETNLENLTTKESHRFFPENPEYEHHDLSYYRWILDDKGEVHFGLGAQYSHWDLMRNISTDVAAAGYYWPSKRKLTVSENYTYDDLPVVVKYVQSVWDELMTKESAVPGITIKEIEPGEAFYNWQGKYYIFDPTYDNVERQGYNAYYGDSLVGSVTFSVRVDHIFLESMYVAPDYRGRGLSRSLLEEIRTEYPNLPVTGAWNPYSPMNQLADDYNSLVGKVAARGWYKWIYDPESGEYHEWEGPISHIEVGQMVWPDKDMGNGNWWGGSKYVGSNRSVPADYHAEVYYAPPEYGDPLKTKIFVPDEVIKKWSKIAANYFYIKPWNRSMTRWLYFPHYRLLFARPFMDVHYMNHMQMLQDIIKLYPHLEYEEMDGGYVTSTGQVNVTMGASVYPGLNEALQEYNETNQSSPLPH